MAKPSAEQEPRAGRGVTLIELVVGMSIAGIVFAAAMFSWTYISRHTTMQQRKSIFGSQADQTVSLIVNDLRKSSGVIAIEAHAIAYLSADGGDTVRYRLDIDTLRKNDTAVALVAPCSKISQFTIEKVDSVTAGGLSYTDPDKQQDAILAVTIGMQDCHGNHSVVRLAAKARLLAPNALLSGSKTWNW